MNVHHVTFSILLDSKNKILIIKYTLSNAGEGVYIYIYIYIYIFLNSYVKSNHVY